MSARIHPRYDSLLGVLGVGFLLIALACLTFGLSRLSLGKAELPIALVIAAAKAVLIVLIFMRLKDHGGASRLAVGVCCVFLAALIGLVLGDVGLRYRPTRPPGPIPMGTEPPPSTLAITPSDFHAPEGGRGQPDQGRGGP